VLRALELRQYAQLKKHVDGFVASLLGISEADERRYLSALAESKLIRKRTGLWRVTHGLTVDTRSDAKANRLKQYWAKLGAERAFVDTQGRFVTTCSASQRQTTAACAKCTSPISRSYAPS
jgi:hypothetical protein